MQVADLISTLRRDWWPVVLVPILALGITFAIQPAKTYSATDTVQVVPAGSVSNINAGTLTVLLPGVVGAMQNPQFGDDAAAAANLPASVADAPVRVAVSGDPTTGLVTITATGPDASPVAPWAKAYGDYLISNKNVVDPNNLTTISPVSTSAATLKSRSTKVELIGAGLLGLIVGLLVSIALGFYRSDRADPEKIRQRFGTDVVVRTPFISARARHQADRSVLDQTPAVHELNLLLKLSEVSRSGSERVQGRSRVIAVLSETRGEGRTEVTNGLAWEMARSGQSVAVVHADLLPPRPGADPPPTPPEDEQGVAPVKAPAHFDLAKAQLHPAQVVLTALPQAIEALSDQHDVVLVDGPPMSAGADAQVVAVLAGAVLWVSERHTDRNQMRRRLTELDQHGVVLLGLVFNRTPRRLSRKRPPADRSTRRGRRGKSGTDDAGGPSGTGDAGGPTTPRTPRTRPASKTTTGRTWPGQGRPTAVGRTNNVLPLRFAASGPGAGSPPRPARRPGGGLSWG